MKVPFVDLQAQVAAHRGEYLAAIAGVIDSAAFVGGPAVADFEDAFARYCSATHAVAMSTGTDALLLALRAAGIGPGDEVITAANSFFATAEAIVHAGARPVFADVDDATLLLSPERTAAAITARTRAIIPVHLFGQLADMDAFAQLAEKHDLVLIEDAAQAHGATRRGRRAGHGSAAACYSFYPAKNLGAFGEGGAVTTHSAEMAQRMRELRDHGQASKHDHRYVGYNARLPSILCAGLSVSLRYLEEANAARRRAAAQYRELLAKSDRVRFVEVAADSEPVYHLFVIRVADRDAVAASLAAKGIGTAVHYPRPIYRQPAFADTETAQSSLPVTERACGEILSLPMFPSITSQQIERVVSSLLEALGD